MPLQEQVRLTTSPFLSLTHTHTHSHMYTLLLRVLPCAPSHSPSLASALARRMRSRCCPPPPPALRRCTVAMLCRGVLGLCVCACVFLFGR